MNSRKNVVLSALLLASAGVMTAGDLWAGRVNFSVGVHSGGSFFSLGVNGGDRCRAGHRPPPCFHPPRRMPPPMFAPPIVCAPVVVSAGRWVEREERVWIEGCWVESVDAYGRRCKIWQPGRWEIRRIREWEP